MPVTDSQRVHHGEWPALVLSFLYFFCVLAAYYVIRPVREQLAAAVGSTQLPWFYAATFVAMLALAPVYGAVVSRWPRRVVVPALNLVFIACLLAFMPFFAHTGLLSPRALGIAFFVWVSVFNLFVVSMFWIFMTDIWTPEQARRLFPLIAVAGTVGAIAGPAATQSMVKMIGVAPLLAVSAGLLGIAVACVIALGHWARTYGAKRHDPGHESAIGGSMWDGLKQIFATPFMRAMAILLLLADGIGTVNYALVNDYAHVTFLAPVERTAFFANVDKITNIGTALAQLLVTRWLLPRKGPGVVIVIWASISAAMLLMVALSQNPHAPMLAGLPVVALALIVSRALAYGMTEPARHALFASVPRTLRYKGQSVVDTAVWRFGDVTIAASMNLLRGIGASVGVFALLSSVSALMAGAIGWHTAKQAQDARDAARPD